MPICISCSHPVSVLYTTYSRADDRALGKGVRLTQCQHCKKFADKYVEHDFVVLFIDLVLIKPQVSAPISSLRRRAAIQHKYRSTDISFSTASQHPPPRIPLVSTPP